MRLLSAGKLAQMRSELEAREQRHLAEVAALGAELRASRERETAHRAQVEVLSEILRGC